MRRPHRNRSGRHTESALKMTATISYTSYAVKLRVGTFNDERNNGFKFSAESCGCLFNVLWTWFDHTLKKIFLCDLDILEELFPRVFHSYSRTSPTLFDALFNGVRLNVLKTPYITNNHFGYALCNDRRVVSFN